MDGVDDTGITQAQEEPLDRVRRRLAEAEAAGLVRGTGGRLPDRAPVRIKPGPKTAAEIISEQRG